MKSAAVVFYVLILGLSAIGQVETDGTIIVINASQQEIVIAADSRTNGSFSYSDRNCKISAFGNKIVVAISGRAGQRHVQDSRFWDAYTIAGEEFRRITRKGTSKNLPIDLAKSWGVTIKKEIESRIRHDRSLFVGLDNHAIMSAVFAGFVNNQRLVAMIEITYQDTGNLPPRIIVSEPHILTDGNFPHWMGKHEVIDQLSMHTFSSDAWARQIAAVVRISPDPVAAEAVEWVRLTIDHLPATKRTDTGIPFSEVGYPISAVRLTDNGAEWVEKGNCPQD